LVRKPLDLMPFPSPGSSDPDRFPLTGRALRSFSGRDVIKGEVYPITMGFQEIRSKDFNATATSESGEAPGDSAS
jgi:hypothetical protein